VIIILRKQWSVSVWFVLPWIVELGVAFSWGFRLWALKTKNVTEWWGG